MWFKITSFFRFLKTSTNQHGVHSPFVYNLVTKCFYTKTNKSKINSFITIKQWLNSNKKIITVTDFGNGSKTFKSNNRKVSDIAKIAGISTKRALLLIRVIEYFKPQTILEIGTSVGLGTSALSIGNPNAQIISLEGCENTASIAQELFKANNFNTIKLVTGNFNNTIPLTINNKQFDLIYFDGNHTKDATLKYFRQCLSTIHNDSVFIFDDINWSKEMQLAWKEIKNHPKVTITIDIFFWGFVFFRKEQAKQHFTIRI
ncbi:O-methyltransferase [Lutibacter sp. B1]|uniref:O-methyltransferase n=1 Tax=Lutibacter sp. B1 TaxID=2725996 RepID=UPI00145650EB|nr:class I SAM-dependent methyltransferase [Lutibacter sp. B1]NLP57912.1 class I SAM-dependent methyltransferase [Lutibacter sp. B1]